jgi:hypothetical protein
LPLYGLTKLPAEGPVYLCEGEKCVDALASIGLPAVTSAHGAESAHKSNWTPLAGRTVIGLPDNDPPGQGYLESAAGILTQLTPPATVKVIPAPLPGLSEPGADVADWLDVDGPMGSRDGDEIRAALEALTDAAPVWAPASEPGLTLPPSVDAAVFLGEPLPMADAIVGGLLRRAETATLVSQSKARKSWSALGLTVAVASGGRWFDLQCRQGRALLLDAELQPATLQARLRAVLDAVGVSPETIANHLAVACWRGREVTLEGLTAYLNGIKAGDFDLIVADPIYKLYPRDPFNFNENDNAHMAMLFSSFQALAERAQAALLLVCHSPKGDLSGRTAIDLVSGAGSAGRAVDVAIALRPHAASKPGSPVIARETIARSFPDLAPACFRWEHPCWVPAPTLDPADLARPSARRKRKKQSNAQPAKTVADEAADFASRFIGEQPKPRAAILDAAVQEGFTENRAKNLLKRAEARGLAYRWTFGAAKPVQFASVKQGQLDFDKDES